MERAWIDAGAEYIRDDQRADEDFDEGVAYPTGDICRVCSCPEMGYVA